MLNWSSSLSIWGNPNHVLFPSHHLRSPWFLHRRISSMILVGYISSVIWTIVTSWTKRSKGFRRACGVSLFSQQKCYYPVLKFQIRSYSIDGLPLYILQGCLIPQGSCLVHIKNRHTKPPWPGDIKRFRLTHDLQWALTIWYVLTGLYVRGFFFRSMRRQVIFMVFIQANLRIISESKQEVYYRLRYRQVSDAALLFSDKLKETVLLSEQMVLRNRPGSEGLKTTRSRNKFLQQNNLKTWLYRLQQIMLSLAVGVFGTDCDVTDGSHPMIF